MLILVQLISPFTAFLFYRGRAFVYLGNREAQCRQISLSSSIFIVNKPIHVQLTVNYFNSSEKYTHEAAVAWTEDVSSAQFRICVLTAGRLDRVPPDGGLTYVDYIAYQGNPVGSVTGHENLTSWWDGTNCKEVFLPQVCYWISPNHFYRALFQVRIFHRLVAPVRQYPVPDLEGGILGSIFADLHNPFHLRYLGYVLSKS